jgi:hypothetical protein
MAARAYAPQAIEVIARCLQSKDERIALMAASIMLDRGFGKPEITADVGVTHKFAYAIVPEPMEKAEWLARRGQPANPLPTLTLVPGNDEPDPAP